MKKNCGGFILLLTILTTLVISMLSITGLHHILLYHKTLNKQKEHHQNFYELERVAANFMRSDSLDKDCVETQDMANEAIKWLTQGKGCIVTWSQKRYLYLVEDLGVFPCQVMEQQKPKAAHHLRISLLLLDPKDNTHPLLQIRFIKPSTAAVHCSGQEHPVSEGISSWRYMPIL